MAVKKKKARKTARRKPVRKKPASRKVVRRSAPKKRAKRKTTTVSSLKSRIRAKLNDSLKDQLFIRDKATTHKQHRSAQLKIDDIRRELRKAN